MCVSILVKVLSVTFLVLVVSISTALSQDSDDCDIVAFSSSAVDRLSAEPNLEVLRVIANEIALLDAKCNGLSFEGTSQVVLGPVEVPEGIYRVTVNTPGFVIVRITPIEGTCGQRSDDDRDYTMFSESQGEASPAQTVFQSAGCSILIEFDNLSDPEWTLTFEKVQ